MNSIPDAAAAERKAWLREFQDAQMPVQSDFEKSLTFRLSMIVAAVVIGLNLFAPPPTTAAPHAVVRAMV
ncbi:hypothetical protein [Paraburkholderia dilworthii]|uniref:Uncharacterized protein n=1 Tax=Paraburkholderia dilworthii TaxID=948106 RepID=A0ABW9DAY5_9BURK